MGYLTWIVNEPCLCLKGWLAPVRSWIAHHRFIVVISLLMTSGLSAVVIVSLSNSIQPVGIVIHHLAVPAWAVREFSVPEIDRLHQERGFGAFYWGRMYHIGYHFLIFPDGTIGIGRPEHLRGAHAIGHNNWLGICLVGDFSARDNAEHDKGPAVPTFEQLHSLANLVQYLKRKYSLAPTQIVLHQDLDPLTQCPGELFPRELLDALRRN